MDKKKHTTLVVDSEDLDAIEHGLQYWIEQNERTLLDDMNMSDRDERLDQLNYHVKLLMLQHRVLEASNRLFFKEIELFNDDQKNAKAEAPAGKRYWVDGKTLLRDKRNVVKEQLAKKAKK